MQLTQITLKTNGAFAMFVTIFGFQVSGVGKFLPKPDTRHPKPTLFMTAKAQKSRQNSYLENRLLLNPDALTRNTVPVRNKNIDWYNALNLYDY